MASPKEYRLMDFIENNLALFLVSVTIIVVERVIKFYITELRMGESVPVIGTVLMITRSENQGAAFGMMQGFNWIFIVAALAVLTIIVLYYHKIIYNRLLVFASAFILAGTVGNMMDRLFFGGVIDYIDLSFWPTFNISDASLTIGVIMLIIYMYFWHQEPQKTRENLFAKY